MNKMLFLIGILIIISSILFSSLSNVYGEKLPPQPIILDLPVAASTGSNYLQGYDDGFDGNAPINPNNDSYMKGWDAGTDDRERDEPYNPEPKFRNPIPIPPDPIPAPRCDEPSEEQRPPFVNRPGAPHPKDCDPDSKGGGADPIVVGDWYYTENSGEKCKSEYRFDFDNDISRENFCYVINGSIFVIDYNGDGKITQGFEMFNFVNTDLQWYTPIHYLNVNDGICDYYNCYLWNDYNHNWITDDGDLSQFTLKIDKIIIYDEGKILDKNGRYIYCYGKSIEGFEFYCLQPTYWQRGII